MTTLKPDSLHPDAPTEEEYYAQGCEPVRQELLDDRLLRHEEDIKRLEQMIYDSNQRIENSLSAIEDLLKVFCEGSGLSIEHKHVCKKLSDIKIDV